MSEPAGGPPHSPHSPESGWSWLPRRRDLAVGAAFTLFWLLPLAISGVSGGPPRVLPAKARDFYAVSCLFATASDRVSVFYVQVWRQGARGWEDFDEREYFGLEPFGHRTRFDRFMARFGYRDRAEPARAEMARWLVAQDAEQHPERASIIRVRYLWTDVWISVDAPPTGHWRKRPRGELGAVEIRQLGETLISGEGGTP